MQTAEERKAYNKAYYKKNKKRISRRKKVRYATDVFYKTTVKGAAMKRFREKIQKKPVEKLGAFLKRPLEPRGSKLAKVNGKLVVLRTITEVAVSIGYTTAAMRNWHNAGILPDPAYIDASNKRWYDNSYVLSLRKAIMMRNGKSLDEFKLIIDKCFEGVV